MSAISLVGGTLITPKETRFTSISCLDGRISAIGSEGSSEPSNLKNSENPGHQRLDVSGCYVTPGLIDLQVNGGPRCNFWADPTASDVQALSDDLLKAGVTTILPTLITDDIAHLRKNIDFLKSVGVGRTTNKSNSTNKASQKPAVYMPGIHLEGPCLSPKRPGVHPPKFIQPLNVQILQQLVDEAILLMTIAPEGDTSEASIDYLRQHNIVASLGHSNATFEEANIAFGRGIKLVTHTFNALPPLHHRSPGAVTAALLDDKVSCALIADGKHVSPAAATLVFKIKGVDKVVLVTDAAYIGTTGGDLVGSSITLNEAVVNMVEWHAASFAQAIRMSTHNAAKAVGLEDEIGELAIGKRADIVVWDKATLTIRHVLSAGQLVF